MFKKLIEFSLVVGKAPVIQFKPLDKFNLNDFEEVSSAQIPPLNKVEDPDQTYKSKHE